MDDARMRSLVEHARVARLATVADDGRIRLVPCTFTLVGDRVYTAVDHKPKRTRDLARLQDIEERPAVTVLVDHYDDGDWTQLWWVRLQGQGRVLRTGVEREAAVSQLAEKYPQYQDRRPDGPVIAVDVETWLGWSAVARATPQSGGTTD